MPLDYVNDTVGHVYTAPKIDATAQVDALGLSNNPQVAGVTEPLGSPRFKIFPTDDPDLIRWQIEIYDLRGGFNRPKGSFADIHDRIYESTFDARWPEMALANSLTTYAATPDPSNTPEFAVWSTNIFNRLVMAVTAYADNYTYLYRETSATDPTVTSLTYNKGAGHSITGLAAVQINGVDYLAVQKYSQAVELLSDVANPPTSLGSMNSVTAGCYGIIQTSLPDTSLLIKSGFGGATQSIYSIKSTDAYNVTPDTRISGLPYGGYAIGLQSLGGGPVRAYWNWPTQAPSGTALQPGGTGGASQPLTYYGQVWSTDQSGQYPEKLRLPLKYVTHSAICRDGIVASDGDRIIFTNGKFVRDLKIFQNRYDSSTYRYKVIGFYIQDNQELFVEVNRTGGSFTLRQIEYYNWDLNTWVPVSGIGIVAANIQSFMTGGSLPVSNTTGFFHDRVGYGSAGSWARQYQPPAGTTPHQFVGSGVINFENGGVYTSPVWEIPGLEGWLKVGRRIVFKGDVDSGGTGSGGGTAANIKVTCNAGNLDTSTHSQGNFVTGMPNEHQVRDFEDTSYATYTIQVGIIANNQSGGTNPTYYTINALPIVIEGFAMRRPMALPSFRVEADV